MADYIDLDFDFGFGTVGDALDAFKATYDDCLLLAEDGDE